MYALSVLDRQFLAHQQVSPKPPGGRRPVLDRDQDRRRRRVHHARLPVRLAAACVLGRRRCEAARLYGLMTTYYVLVSGWVVAGLALEARWIIRVLAPHNGYFGGYRAVPWLSLGWALYGLWVVFLVIAARANVTRRNFPAALAGLVANIVLLAVLVPRYGIAGAGVALCGAYVAMLGSCICSSARAFHGRLRVAPARADRARHGRLRDRGRCCCCRRRRRRPAEPRRRVRRDPARAASHRIRAPGRARAGSRAARPRPRGPEARVSRPPVSVVVPFAGDRPQAARRW